MAATAGLSASTVCCATSATAGSNGPCPASPAIGALVTGVEIWLEHDRASFANRMMWIPVALTPAMSAAGVAGVFSRRAAKTFLPVVSTGRGGQQPPGPVPAPAGDRPAAGRAGKLARYNLEMGPPTFAPLLFGLVGGMGLLAAVLRRED